MGFSTWNEFGCAISETTLVNTGQLMIRKHPADWEGKESSLKDAGYTQKAEMHKAIRNGILQSFQKV